MVKCKNCGAVNETFIVKQSVEKIIKGKAVDRKFTFENLDEIDEILIDVESFYCETCDCEKENAEDLFEYIDEETIIEKFKTIDFIYGELNFFITKNKDNQYEINGSKHYKTLGVNYYDGKVVIKLADELNELNKNKGEKK